MEQDMTKARSVKEKHTPILLQHAAVTGVGIGQEPGKSQICINVYIRNLAELPSEIPKHLDGFPVNLIETGDIEAL